MTKPTEKNETKAEQPESMRSKLPQSVLDQHEENMKFAAEYERLYGDPIDNLIELLSELAIDDDDDSVDS
jgi:hypothetical protein